MASRRDRSGLGLLDLEAFDDVQGVKSEGLDGCLQLSELVGLERVDLDEVFKVI